METKRPKGSAVVYKIKRGHFDVEHPSQENLRSLASSRIKTQIKMA